MYCSKCGSFNDDDDKFCVKCGASITSEPPSIYLNHPHQQTASQFISGPQAKDGLIPNRGKKQLIIGIAAISVIITVTVVLAICYHSPTKNREDAAVANNVNIAAGNIANYGTVAQQGKWIYYSGINFNRVGGLYKVNIDGTGKMKLDNNMAVYINVVGDWIYYSKVSQDSSFPGGSLYKIRTDGTEKTKLTNDDTAYINVIIDWIYYENGSDNGCIYKMRTDGTDNTKLTNDYGESLNVVGDWIYYANNNDDGCIYKIHTDGTENTKLIGDNAAHINVVGDWIYWSYSEYCIYNPLSLFDPNTTPPTNSYNIYKMHTDGTGYTKLTNDESEQINVAGDWVYYINDSADNCIYKIRTDGTGKTKVNNDYSYRIIILNDWIYYINEYDQNLYKIRMDGTDQQEVAEFNSSESVQKRYDLYNASRIAENINIYNSKSPQMYITSIDSVGDLKEKLVDFNLWPKDISDSDAERAIKLISISNFIAVVSDTSTN